MRRIQFILVLLLIGAVLNISLAWLFAAWIAIGGSQNLVINNTAGLQQIVDTESWLGMSRINRAQFSDLTLDSGGSMATVRWSGNGEEHSELQCGWPMHSLHCLNYGEINIRIGSSVMGMQKSGLNPIVGGIELPPGAKGWRALPYLPMWFGFVLNTMFWALIAWAVIVGVFGWRRRRRIKRGLCVVCGYDLTGAEHLQCPECGSPVRAKPPAAMASS